MLQVVKQLTLIFLICSLYTHSSFSMDAARAATTTIASDVLCTICQDPLVSVQEPTCTFECKHSLHVECYKSLCKDKETNVICPICRACIVYNFPDKKIMESLQKIFLAVHSNNQERIKELETNCKSQQELCTFAQLFQAISSPNEKQKMKALGNILARYLIYKHLYDSMEIYQRERDRAEQSNRLLLEELHNYRVASKPGSFDLIKELRELISIRDHEISKHQQEEANQKQKKQSEIAKLRKEIQCKIDSRNFTNSLYKIILNGCIGGISVVATDKLVDRFIPEVSKPIRVCILLSSVALTGLATYSLTTKFESMVDYCAQNMNNSN